ASYFSRQDFLKSLDRFYGALEAAADTIDDYSQKQTFLNTVYEKFFQGFSVNVADTHGIVYTPQPIVDFMVRSVEDILQREFGRSLSSQGVHILDPFVGTGNFIMRIMHEMKKTALEYKYKNEIHCNEAMLLPYYVASMNIEHEYWTLAFFASLRWLIQKALQDWHIISQSRRLLAGRLQHGAGVLIAMVT